MDPRFPGGDECGLLIAWAGQRPITTANDTTRFFHTFTALRKGQLRFRVHKLQFVQLLVHAPPAD